MDYPTYIMKCLWGGGGERVWCIFVYTITTITTTTTTTAAAATTTTTTTTTIVVVITVVVLLIIILNYNLPMNNSIILPHRNILYTVYF